jgi:UDP-N-acetyl-D-mannosaminuronic acid transferase (WecB/TagA/CpsF family)
MNTVSLLNTSIHNIGLQELLAKLDRYGGFVVTPNVDHVVRLQQDVELLNAYQQPNHISVLGFLSSISKLSRVLL